MGKQLNLKWVSDAIGEDFKKWKKGDIIRIQAQTGTGKTYFITGDANTYGIVDTLEDWEKMIYICNRTELKRQIKIQLLEKYGEKIPCKKDNKDKFILDKKGKKQYDMKQIDDMTVIKNITITSYHAISFGRLDKIYLDKNVSLDDYEYIICDECHFFMTDAGYNNKAYLALEELIKTRHRNAIKIFISATMDEISLAIQKMSEELKNKGFGSYANFTIYPPYTTGIDYSYLDVSYFKKIKDIIQLIKNDTTDEKWIIFVTSKSMGEKILEDLEKKKVTATFIHANTSKEDKEKINIATKSKFNSKVLICTKCLDNGVNIKDNEVKNLVVMTYDKTTFIQEIGRRRLNIKDAPQVNLFIPMYTKKVFQGKIDENYQPKINMIEVFEADENVFKRQYNNDLDRLPYDIFYLDKDNEWTINDLGYARVYNDRDFANEMVELFEHGNDEKKDGFAFVKKQLEWLELGNTFDELNLIEDVADDEEVETLKSWLNENYSNDTRFKKEEFIQQIEKIIKLSLGTSLEEILTKLDASHKRDKGMKQYNKLFSLLELPYLVSSKVIKETIEGKRKNITYWIIGKEE